MKKNIYQLLYLIVLVSVSIGFIVLNTNLVKENKKLYNKFLKYNIIGVNGKANLSELESKRDSLSKELFSYNYTSLELFNNKLKETRKHRDILSSEAEDLSNEIDNLSLKKESLIKEYSTLKDKVDKIEEEIRKSRTVYIDGVPLINQYPKYPTGCESVALTMLLQYYGINVVPEDVIYLLKKGDAPYYENGILYGGNPEIEFIGTPYSASSYGVYNYPIYDVANYFKSGVYSSTDVPFSKVLELVKDNHPVIVWTSMYLSTPMITSTWIYKPTNEIIYWKGNLHAAIVIGYDDNNIIIADSLGGVVRYQPRSTFEYVYNYYGKRVVYY